MNEARDRLRVHQVRIVALTGELDVYATGWRTVLRDVDGETILIDLSGATYLSAAFVGELARLRKRLPHARIKTVGTTADHRRIFDLLHVDEMLRPRVAV